MNLADGFKLSHGSATPEKALAAADQLEREVGEVLAGERKAGKISVEAICTLVQFARDVAKQTA